MKLEPPKSSYQNLNTGQTTANTTVPSTSHHTASIVNLLLSPQKELQKNVQQGFENRVYENQFYKFGDKATSAKPVDYLVAGTEGLAWIVHFCFTLSLRKSSAVNPRGPVFIRVLIILLLGISSLLLKSHIDEKPQDDVLPNLSLGFSITVVSLLVLYVLTLIPDRKTNSRTRDTPRFSEVCILWKNLS